MKEYFERGMKKKRVHALGIIFNTTRCNEPCTNYRLIQCDDQTVGAIVSNLVDAKVDGVNVGTVLRHEDDA